MVKRSTIFFGFILIILIAGGVFIASKFDFPVKSKKVLWMEKSNQSASNAITDKLKRPDTFVELIKREKPSVVNISTTQMINRRKYHPWDLKDKRGNPFDDFFNKFFEEMPKGELKRQSLGSGFIISNDGYILTNCHVVENATKITITLSDEREYEAIVVGRDPKTDIALIKIPSNGNLPLAYLGNSDSLEVGEWVIAIGNPFGLAHTVTAGIVSAKGRVIGIGSYDNFIQTDTSINPGNSGGPLFNTNGEVVGINTAIVAAGQGIGFATPINMAKEILKSLKEEGRVTRGWLGVNIQPIDVTIAKTFNLTNTKGALVGDVIADAPAEKAGIKRGDVIIQFNGKNIDSYHDLPRIVGNTRVGEIVDVVVIRNGEQNVLKVLITELKDIPVIKSSVQISDRLGLIVSDIDPLEAKELNIPSEGIIVKEIKRGSLSDEYDLRVGDIILEINKKKISGVEDYKKVLKKAEEEKNLVMLIVREGRSFYLSIKIK